MIILRRTSAGLLALALVSGVSACSGARSMLPLHRGARSASPTASPSPSPTTEPTRPADAEHGLRDWVAAANHAFATGDTTHLRALSEPGCNCLKIADHVQDEWAHGSIRGLAWSLHDVKVVTDRSRVADVWYQYDEPHYTVIRDGKTTSGGADRVTVMCQLHLSDGVWKMRRYLRQTAPPR